VATSDVAGQHRLAAPPSRAAVLRVYHLVEQVQTDRVERAREEIGAGLSEQPPGTELHRLLRYADAVDAVVNAPERAEEASSALIRASELDADPAMLATGLGLRAEMATRAGDIASALQDTSRGVSLLDLPGDPLARVSGLISVAETYSTMRLWELGDELYDLAAEILPDCDDRLLEPVRHLNRAFVRFWWAAGLLEVGASPDAVGLREDEAPSQELLGLPMPDTWRRMLLVSLCARRVLLGVDHPEDQAWLRAQHDLLVGPEVRVQSHLAFAHAAIRSQDWQLALREVETAERTLGDSLTPHHRSLLAWTASLAERGALGIQAPATLRYAETIARQRWDERLSRLASARAQVQAERLKREHETLLRRTLEDPLTGLGNRRAFDDRLNALARTVGADTDIAMVVVDIDHFKRINDLFGHVVGDLVLERVGTVLSSMLRPTDLAVRLGGDEFCAVLVGAQRDVVEQRAERLRRLVEDQEWEQLAPGLVVGVSVGAASGRGHGDVPDLYRRADQALYLAKAEGRGRLRLAT